MSFFKLYEQTLKPVGDDTWYHDKDNDFGEIIKRGLELRPDRESGLTFWDDFISLFSNNSSDAAKLLGVTPDKIISWNNKIKKAINDQKTNQKTQITKTGVEN